jgi:hypothetical protein
LARNPNLKYFGYYFGAVDGIGDLNSSNGLDEFKRHIDICKDHCNLVMIQIGSFTANIELMDYAITNGFKIILISTHIYKVGRNSTTQEFEVQDGNWVELANNSLYRDYITSNSGHFFGIYFSDEPFWYQGLRGNMTKEHWYLANQFNRLYLKLKDAFGSIPQIAPFAYPTLTTISTDWGTGIDQRVINHLRFEYASVSGAYINAKFKDFKPVRDFYTTLRKIWIDEAVPKFKDKRRIFVTGDAFRVITSSSDKGAFEKQLIQRSIELFDFCKSDDRVIAYIPFMFPSSSGKIDGVETFPNLLNKFRAIGKEITGR